MEELEKDCPCSVCGGWFTIQEGKIHPYKENELICSKCAEQLTIKTMKALEVKEDGLIYVDGILVSDQEKAKRIIWKDKTGISEHISDIHINPGIYPIPGLQWELSAKDVQWNGKWQEVAILKESTPSNCSFHRHCYGESTTYKEQFCGCYNEEQRLKDEQLKDINVTQSEQDPCLSCGKSVREQAKGCNIIYCYRQFLPKKTEQESHFNGCSPTACGCKSLADCPNNQRYVTVDIKDIRVIQSEQESQEDLWRRVERYIDWPYQEINVTELMKHFTITRKQ